MIVELLAGLEPQERFNDQHRAGFGTGGGGR
jgi:hypothetical protein